MLRAVLPSGRKSLLLVALIAVIGITWWWSQPHPPPEPVRNDQRLSEWLANAKAGGLFYLIVTRERLQAFGPGTVPWLAYTAEHGRHRSKGPGPLPFEKAPDWLRRWLPEKWGGGPAPSKDEREQALWALYYLGPDAASATPALARILERGSEDDHDVARSNLAALDLQGAGPASWPVVVQTLKHGKPSARKALLSSIDRRVGTFEIPAPEAEVAKVVAILDEACTDPDPELRMLAVDAIRDCCRRRPDLFAFSFTDELLRLLSSPIIRTRMQALEILRNSDAKAPRAIPRLIELLDDRHSDIRNAAAQVLGKLDTVEKLSAAHLLAMFLDDPDAGCRSAAGDALEDLGLPQDDESSGEEASPEQ